MFIGRRADGSIYGVWTCRQPNDADHQNMEELPSDHPDIVAFVTRPLISAVNKVDELEARIAALEAKTGA